MFNLDYIQYIVFGILAIPPFIIGFKKGWKAALLSTIVLLALSGAIVALSYMLYDKTLWPMFRNMFVAKHVGWGLNPDELSVLSKPSIIVTVLGIMILPSFFIAWLVFFIFKKLLLKHMQPRVKRLNDNQAKIWRKNNIHSKLIGGTILGTSGIVIAATAAGAVSTFTVPTNKDNFFTKAITALGKGYSYNTGYYDSDYQHMYEYLPMTHEVAEMSSLKRVFALNANDPIKSTDVDTIVNSKEWHAKTKELLSKKRSAIALVKLAISDNNQYDLTNSGSSKAINNLRMTIDNSKLKFNMPSDAIDEVTEYILKNRILQFEKTSVYLDWQDAVKTVKRLAKELDVLKVHKQELADLRIKLASDLRTLENDRDIVQPRIVSETAAAEPVLKKKRDDTKVIWQGLIPPMTEAEGYMKTAQSEYSKAEHDFNSKNDDWEYARQAKLSNDAEISNLERNIASATNRIKDNERKVTDAGTIMTRLDNELISLRKVVSNKQSDISTKNNKKSSEEATRISAQAKYASLMAIYNDNTKPQQDREKAHKGASSEQSKINSATNKINSINSEISALEAEMNAAKSSIVVKEPQKLDQQMIINRAKRDLDYYKDQKLKDESSLLTRKGNVANLEQDRDDKRVLKEAAERTKKDKHQILNTKIATYQEAKRKHDEASDKYWKAKTTYDNNQQRWQAAKGRIHDLNNNLIPHKNNEITTNDKAIIDNQKEIDTKINKLNSAKSDEKVKEDLKIKENKKFDSKKKELREIYKSALK